MAYAPKEEQEVWNNWANALSEQNPELAESIVRSIIADASVKSVESNTSEPTDDESAVSEKTAAAIAIKSVASRQESGHHLTTLSHKNEGASGDRDLVGLYLREVGRYPLLTADEEKTLAQVIEIGRQTQQRSEEADYAPTAEDNRAIREGQRAKEQFILSNLRLVISIAKRYPVSHAMDLMDIIQEGNLGLEHAVDMFDWRKGFKFSTYATYWIKQGIGRALDQKSNLIRLPHGKSTKLRSALKICDSEGNNLDPKLSGLYALTTPTSLDKTVGDEGDQVLGDLIRSESFNTENEAISNLNMPELQAVLDELDPRLHRMLDLRYGLNGDRAYTFREIGDKLGITAEGARRIVNNALDDIKRAHPELREQLLD
jgi:RNA polymerase primary sigma factor